MIFCGMTSDYGLVCSTTLPNAFAYYMNDGGVHRWSSQFSSNYDSARHIQFTNSYTRLVVALNPFAIFYLKALDGSLIRSYSDLKSGFSGSPGMIRAGGMDVYSNVVHIAS